MNTLQYRAAFADYLPHMRRPETQQNWHTVLKAFEGLTLTPAELAWFRDHSGRQGVRPGAYSELVLIVGRQAGKDDICADTGNARAVHSLLTNERVDGLFISFVAQDFRAAVRTLFHRVSYPWTHIPELAQHVASKTADSLTLTNGLILACFPCRPPALRGLRNLRVCMNETAHYRNSAGNPVDVEMRRAVLPTLATTGGQLVIASSPYFATDLLGELRRRHYGRDESPTLVIQASAPEMNCTLPKDYLERMRADDPTAYAAEVLGQFRSGESTLFDSAQLDEVTRTGRGALPPQPDVTYFGGADMSGGKRDAGCVSIAHREGARTVVDLVRAWKAPHSPTQVIAEAAAHLKLYGVHEVVADRYASGFQADTWRANHIHFRPTELDRSGLYLHMHVLVQSGAVELPDDAALLKELRGLVRKRGFAGKDRCDHLPNATDDRANAAAASIYAARAPRYASGVARAIYGPGSGAPREFVPATDMYTHREQPTERRS
jgi:hypothetical protein